MNNAVRVSKFKRQWHNANKSSLIKSNQIPGGKSGAVQRYVID